jgi:hypothetical protein
MDSISHSGEQRARWKYERARLLRATLAFAPASILVGAACVMASHHWMGALSAGGVLLIAGIALLWYGRSANKAVLPGILLGLAPLIISTIASHAGHVCMGGACFGWCIGLWTGVPWLAWAFCLGRKSTLNSWRYWGGLESLRGPGAMGCVWRRNCRVSAGISVVFGVGVCGVATTHAGGSLSGCRRVRMFGKLRTARDQVSDAYHECTSHGPTTLSARLDKFNSGGWLGNRSVSPCSVSTHALPRSSAWISNAFRTAPDASPRRRHGEGLHPASARTQGKSTAKSNGIVSDQT